MKITTDDDIWRYSPRLIDLKGWTVPGQPTYASLVLGFLALFVTFPIARILIGGPVGLLVAVVAAILLGGLLSHLVTTERGLLDYAASIKSEVVGFNHAVRCRRAAHRATPRTHSRSIQKGTS